MQDNTREIVQRCTQLHSIDVLAHVSIVEIDVTGAYSRETVERPVGGLTTIEQIFTAVLRNSQS